MSEPVEDRVEAVLEFAWELHSEFEATFEGAEDVLQDLEALQDEDDRHDLLNDDEREHLDRLVTRAEMICEVAEEQRETVEAMDFPTEVLGDR